MYFKCAQDHWEWSNSWTKCTRKTMLHWTCSINHREFVRMTQMIDMERDATLSLHYLIISPFLKANWCKKKKNQVSCKDFIMQCQMMSTVMDKRQVKTNCIWFSVGLETSQQQEKNPQSERNLQQTPHFCSPLRAGVLPVLHPKLACPQPSFDRGAKLNGRALMAQQRSHPSTTSEDERTY